MGKRRCGLVLLTAMLAGSTPGAAQAVVRPAVRLVADTALPDAAMAVAHAWRPVIVYNPRLLTATGPLVAAFLLAHEEAHLALDHRRPDPGRLGDADLWLLLRAYEHQADCRAARTLLPVHPAAVGAAIAYFRGLGRHRPDPEHPTGAERAQALDECLGTARSPGTGGS